MTHPLTPREKVDCVACEGRPSPENNPCAVCGRTALASGSGDHAELIERVREVADDCLDAKDGGIIFGGTVAREHGADLEVLLAENAALRESISRHDRQVSGMLRARLAAENRATEAERKLAEAEGLLRDLASWFDGSAYNGAWVIRSGDLGVDDAICAARTFLSKEAERG